MSRRELPKCRQCIFSEKKRIGGRAAIPLHIEISCDRADPMAAPSTCV